VIRIDVPDVASAGTLIRLLIGPVDAECVSLDAARLSVCVDDPAMAPGTVAKRVEHWLAEVGAASARVHDDRGWFIVRHHGSTTAVAVTPKPTAVAHEVASAPLVAIPAAPVP
jgi:hypothetical protein